MIYCIVEHSDCSLKFESKGHSAIDNLNAQVSISCAAVSVLIRTMGMLFTNQDGIELSLERFQPGSVKLSVHNVDIKNRGWFRGVCDMLLQGLEDVQRDYPNQIVFRSELTVD